MQGVGATGVEGQDLPRYRDGVVRLARRTQELCTAQLDVDVRGIPLSCEVHQHSRGVRMAGLLQLLSGSQQFGDRHLVGTGAHAWWVGTATAGLTFRKNAIAGRPSRRSHQRVSGTAREGMRCGSCTLPRPTWDYAVI